MAFFEEKKVLNANFNNKDTLARLIIRYLKKLVINDDISLIPLLLIRTSF